MLGRGKISFAFLYIAIILCVAAILVGCQPRPISTISGLNFSYLNASIYGQVPVVSNETVSEINVSININNTGGVAVSEQEGNISEILKTIEATEGDLIKLDINAYDPDGDPVQIFYGEPFNEMGLWQTKIGDEGTYLVKVVASDGKTNTTAYIRVIVKRANRPPVIDCPDEVEVNEGEHFVLNCNFYDEDDDEVVVSFSGWMNSKEKDVGYDEAGIHEVLVIANDGKHKTTKKVKVKVNDVNRPPELEVKNVEAMEGDVVVIPYNVSDPDGDEVNVTFSEPFNSQGVWHTTIGDAGIYAIRVVATDGKDVVERVVNVTILMKNTPPVLDAPAIVTTKEGELFELPIDYYDREDKALIVTVSGWMDSLTKQIGYDEAGNHTVTVSVSDGHYTVTKTITVIVEDVNRPPVFVG